MRRNTTRLGVSAGAVAALVLLLLYLQGSIAGARVPPGTVPVALPRVGEDEKTATVERVEVDDPVEWSGTVQSRKVAHVAPRVMARVLAIRVSPGDAVKRGDEVAVLDDRDLRARVDQAKSALAAAEARAAQADAEYRRMKALHAKEAATKRDLEAAEAAFRATAAQVERARDGLREAGVFLDEATVRAPFDGVVVRRAAEPGDLAVPGRALVIIQDPNRLRFEVPVPESHAGAVNPGMKATVRIDALDRDVPGAVEEVAPAADPRSRTVLVKIALEETDGLRPGVFGRFLQPGGSRMALLVPAEAVTRVGQLESVAVRDGDGRVRRRHVKTGKLAGDRVEVLSGLAAGEVVVYGGAGK